MSVPFMNRENPAALAARGGANRYAEDWGKCPSEFLTGCVVPYYVRVSVPAASTLFHKIAPTNSLIPFASVAYLSDPEIEIVQVRNAQGKQAGVTGEGITTTINPQALDWWSTISPWNPIPPDIGVVNNNKAHGVELRNIDPLNPRLYDSIWWGVIPGIEGIEMLMALKRITPEYAADLRRWLAKYDNSGDDSSAKAA